MKRSKSTRGRGVGVVFTTPGVEVTLDFVECTYEESGGADLAIEVRGPQWSKHKLTKPSAETLQAVSVLQKQLRSKLGNFCIVQRPFDLGDDEIDFGLRCRNRKHRGSEGWPDAENASPVFKKVVTAISSVDI
jgi:hypothetical protein